MQMPSMLTPQLPVSNVPFFMHACQTYKSLLYKKKLIVGNLGKAEGSLGAGPVGLSVVGDGDADTAHVSGEAGVVALGKGALDILGALGGEEPRAGAEVVGVGVDEGEKRVLLVVGGVGVDAGDLVLELGDRLRVLQVVVELLHVRGALAGSPRGHVVLVLVVDGLEGRQGDDACDLSRAVHAVLDHGVGEQGTSLVGGAALRRASARLGGGRDLGHDFGRCLPSPGGKRGARGGGGNNGLACQEEAGDGSDLEFHGC